MDREKGLFNYRKSVVGTLILGNAISLGLFILIDLFARGATLSLAVTTGLTGLYLLYFLQFNRSGKETVVTLYLITVYLHLFWGCFFALDRYSFLHIIFLAMGPGSQVIIYRDRRVLRTLMALLSPLLFFYFEFAHSRPALTVYDEPTATLVRFLFSFTGSVLLLLVIRIYTIQITNNERINYRNSIGDPLTGLYNRLYMDRMLERAAAETDRTGKCYGVILLDLDFFKRINDTYGHAAGDRVLQKTARVLADTVRRTDTCFRYGGEEFLILTHDTDEKGVGELAERVRANIGAMDLNLKDDGITASLGVALGGPGQSPKDVCQEADRRLYRAKDEGRNRVVF